MFIELRTYIGFKEYYTGTRKYADMTCLLIPSSSIGNDSEEHTEVGRLPTFGIGLTRDS